MANDDFENQKNDPGEESKAESESGLRLGETLRKVVSVGMGAAFMTEEHIRNYVGDLKLPKDVLANLIQGAGNSKQELLEKVSAEMAKIFKNIDFVKEASRFAEDHKFKITAEIEIKKKDEPSGETPVKTPKEKTNSKKGFD